MTLRIRHIDPDATPSSQVSLETLARIVPETTVAEVLKECNATERRTRKLSAAFVVILCVAMNLYTNDCISHVFFRLLSRVRWLLADPTMAVGVSKGALCQARYRLGARPLVALFKRICSKPLAEPETVPEAFLFGLRLMAVDGTVLDLPDTPENVRVFGKRHSPRGTSAWPQARVVAISECATHAVLEAGVWPHDFDERAAALRLLRGVGEGVLLLWDRGFAQLRDGPSHPRSRLRVAGTAASDGQARTARSNPLGRYAAGVDATLRVRAAQAGRTGAGALDLLYP
jgi:hypothetical protein